MFDSAHVSSMEPYQEILSVGKLPSLPMLLTVPFGPMSSTWSLAAFIKLSFQVKPFIGFCFRKYSIASIYAYLPSLVSIKLRPSSEYRVLPLNLPKHLSRCPMKNLGFCLALFYILNTSYANYGQFLSCIIYLRYSFALFS